MKRWLLTALILTAWWSAVAAVYAEQLVSMGPQLYPAVTAASGLTAIFAGWLLWVPLSMIILVVVESFPIQSGSLVRPVSCAVACIAIAIVVRAIFIYLISPSVPLWYDAPPDFLTVLADSFRNNIVLSCLVIGAAHAVHYGRADSRNRARIARLEVDLAQSRLNLLAAKLNPHFLFNSLNAIAETIHSDPDAADSMTVSLAELLRKALNNDGNSLIPFGEELEMMNHYLSLEATRLRERLRVREEIAQGSKSALIPPLLLQPLVENAIIHGISRLRHGGEIAVRSWVEGRILVLQVSNDWDPSQPSLPSNGYGLDNVRSRLCALFEADGCGLDVWQTDKPPKFHARLAIPQPGQAARAQGRLLSRQPAASA